MNSVDGALWTSLIAIAGIWSITVMSPGPNFIATVHAAVSQSRRTGLWVSLGVAVGTLIWASASLLGLGLLFQTAAWLYVTVKVCGACYLIYIGFRMILSARQMASLPVAAGPRMSHVQAFRRGLITDLSNPKAAAFFTSLFAIAVPPTAPLWFDATLIALVVVIAGGWYALMAWLMALDPVAAIYRRAQKAISYVTGALFISLGVRLAADR